MLLYVLCNYLFFLENYYYLCNKNQKKDQNEKEKPVKDVTRFQ